MIMGRHLAGAAANPTDVGAVRGFKVRDLVPDDVESPPLAPAAPYRHVLWGQDKHSR